MKKQKIIDGMMIGGLAIFLVAVTFYAHNPDAVHVAPKKTSVWSKMHEPYYRMCLRHEHIKCA